MTTTRPKPRILIVDDDKIIVESLSEFLRLEGYEPAGAGTFADAMAELQKRRYSLVISDINMPDSSGFELLRVVKSRFPEIVVIMITGYGTIESAVEAIKMGAYDYLTKPIIDDEIRLVIERALQQQFLIRENRSLREALDLRYGLDNIVGHDYKMLKIFDLIESVADSRTTVLIQGESGTGKSLIARSIHHHSDRRDAPFVEVSCGALPESLLESELFGHVRGSFTGAVADKIGKFEQANQGTIFLDEIATMPLHLQTKLLRVLQEQELERVGSTKKIKLNVRVISATNANLEEEIEQGRFRNDLYYRLNVIPVHLPALRERREDIALLARHFLQKICEEMNRPIMSISPTAMRFLESYHWPGNVRELENVIERTVTLTDGIVIEKKDLPANITGSAAEEEEEPALTCPALTDAGVDLPQVVADLERQLIRSALELSAGVKARAADLLSIKRTTLVEKIKRLGIEE